MRIAIALAAILALTSSVMAQPYQPQDFENPSAYPPPEGLGAVPRGGYGLNRDPQRHHGGRRGDPIVALDALGQDLALNPRQAQLYVAVRADAVKVLTNIQPRLGPDPFVDPRPQPADMAAVDQAREAFKADGSLFFASLDDSQKAIVKDQWDRVFGWVIERYGHEHPEGMRGDRRGPPPGRD